MSAHLGTVISHDVREINEACCGAVCVFVLRPSCVLTVPTSTQRCDPPPPPSPLPVFGPSHPQFPTLLSHSEGTHWRFLIAHFISSFSSPPPFFFLPVTESPLLLMSCLEFIFVFLLFDVLLLPSSVADCHVSR